MNFRNLVIYRLPDWKLTAGDLEDILLTRPLQECTGLSTVSRGFVAPRDNCGKVYSQGKQMLFALGVLTKKLPASAVNQAVKERASQLESAQGFKPGRKQMRELRDTIISEMLPKTVAAYRMTRALIDTANGWLIVDTSSLGRAEEVTEQLRNTLGELKIELPNTKLSPSALMTQWLTYGAADAPFILGGDCELHGTTVEKETIKYARCDLGAPDIRRQITDGNRTAKKLALSKGESVGFVLTDTMQLKRFHYLDIAKQADGQAEPENAEQVYEAEFALFTGALAQLLPALFNAMGGLEA